MEIVPKMIYTYENVNEKEKGEPEDLRASVDDTKIK